MRNNRYSSSLPSSPIHSSAGSPLRSRAGSPLNPKSTGSPVRGSPVRGSTVQGSPLRGSPLSAPTRHTFSASIMEENVEIAESIISKWDTDSPLYCKIVSLFTENRREAKEFLKAVENLQTSMHFFSSESYNSDMLVRCQKLMQTAMKRLQKEFHTILSANRESLDSESVSVKSSLESARSSTSDFEDDSSGDDLAFAGGAVTEGEIVSEDSSVSDLKSIANCMISAGYAQECVKIYKLIRKSIIDETLYHLGVEILTFSQIQKMDWEVTELKIKIWLNAVKVAVKTLFKGERILCDNIFSSSDLIGDSCFAEISKDGARRLFEFPELIAKGKKSPEKMFRILDLYEAIADLWPEVESIFSSELNTAVRTQAVTSLVKLGEAVRAMFADFEMAIQKDISKLPVPGGGVHPLTRYVMNYLSFLTDYSGILSDILADAPIAVQSPLPETYFSSPTPDDSPATAIAIRFAWLILVLLCKLDGKAELYKDASLSYLFLANNLNYVVKKVSSSNLRFLLGEQWIVNHETKVRRYVSNYERMGWSKVTLALPENPTASVSSEMAEETFQKFSTAFEEAYRKQTSWIVTDNKLRDEIKISLARKIVPAYRTFYDRYRPTIRRGPVAQSIVRFAPDDLGNYLSDLFHGMTVSGDASTHSSPSSSHSWCRDKRH